MLLGDFDLKKTMGSQKRLAEEVQRGLGDALTKLRKW